MMSGRLDRRITIQSKTESQDAFGAPIAAWVSFAAVWAERIEMSGREFFTAQQVTPEVIRKYRIRWVSNLTTLNRILDEDGEPFDIVRVAEVGRRHWLELTVKVPTNG